MANFKEIIEQSFQQYSGAVIQSRALVDVRDCLKPSARQIFYCMETDKFTADKPFKKTLKSIGSAMRLYIHGDASCEGIIMRASQPFSFRYPLVEVEGSYGNPMETGNWAAPRYTAARLSEISGLMFSDLKKETIDDWRDNYDDTEQYPSVLPSKGFYNIVNGTFGIGIGIASSIPQFNLKEVNAALIKLLNNPEATFEELYCPPDFATGGTLINEAAVKNSLKKGFGSACAIRAKFEYDEKKKILTVIEIPYNVYTNTICQELETIVNGENNPGIDRINDLTGVTPCIKIYLDKNANVEYIKSYLYKNTSLQSAYGINLTMLDQGKYPKVFTWKQALQAYLEHQELVYIRGFEYDLKKIKHRIEIIEAIIKAIINIEKVIELIKSAFSTTDANLKLQSFLSINEEQAKAILDIKLARLARLEIEKFEKELKELKEELIRISAILASKDLLKKEIVKDLDQVSQKYGDARRTELTNITETKEDKEIAFVEPEKCMVILTESGNIKRVPTASFKIQKRNGKGVKTQNDITSMVLRTNTIDELMIFTNQSRMYRLLVDKIPVGNNTSNGVPVSSLIQMESGEKPTVVYSIYRDTDAKYVLFTTKKGLVKKTLLEEYVKTKKRTGISAITLREGDELANVSLIKNEKILIVTKRGMGIVIDSEEIAPSGRATQGVKGVNVAADDEVLTALPIRDSGDFIGVFTTGGQAKRFPVSELPTQTRGGKGLIISKEEVAAVVLVNDNDSLLVCGNNSSICVEAKDITQTTRTALGVAVLKNNRLNSVSKI